MNISDKIGAIIMDEPKLWRLLGNIETGVHNLNNNLEKTCKRQDRFDDDLKVLDGRVDNLHGDVSELKGQVGEIAKQSNINIKQAISFKDKWSSLGLLKQTLAIGGVGLGSGGLATGIFALIKFILEKI